MNFITIAYAAVGTVYGTLVYVSVFGVPNAIAKEGEKYLLENKIIYERNETNIKKYINDYNSTLDPAVSNEYSTASYRSFHSLIKGYYAREDENRVQVEPPIRLSNYYNKPGLLEEGNNYVELAIGMTAHASAESDRFYNSEVTKYLFRGDNEYGGDLRGLDIQRGRDHGIGNFVEGRAMCGLSVPKSFDDFRPIIQDDAVVDILKSLYENVKDIDMNVGALLEKHVEGSLLGPLYQCIILEQWYRSRRADRYWFENGSDKKTRFTPEQLENIRKMTIAGILCSCNNMKKIQPRAFEQISLSNPLTPCPKIPKINYTLWKEESVCA